MDSCCHYGTANKVRSDNQTSRLSDKLPLLRGITPAMPEPPAANSVEQLGMKLNHWLQEQRGMFGNRLATRQGAQALHDLLLYRYQNSRRSGLVDCPPLSDMQVSPHTLRHGAAMEFLRSGACLATIAMWLGHDSIATKQVRLHAGMAIKKRAMDETRPMEVAAGVYRPEDDLLAFPGSLCSDIMPTTITTEVLVHEDSGMRCRHYKYVGVYRIMLISALQE